jgi:glyceraldehyde 3-phosphate dehydrogenase
MAVKVGINGSGMHCNVLRTRLLTRTRSSSRSTILLDPKTFAHLLKHDSILGNLPHTITAGTDSISIDGKVIKVSGEKDPAALPWESRGAQVL